MKTLLCILLWLLLAVLDLCAQGVRPALVGASRRVVEGGGGANITANIWENFEFATFSTANLAANDNSSDGTWTVGAGTQTTSGTGEKALLATINSTSDSGHSYGMAIDESVGTANYVSFDWTSAPGAAAVSYGFWFKTPTSTVDSTSVMIFRCYGGADYVCRVAIYDDGTKSFRIRGNASYVNHSATWAANTWYWVSVLGDAGGTCRLRIYNDSGTELGTEQTVTAADTTTTGFSLGVDHVYTAGTGSMYWDDLIVDTTDATYPLGPQ
jgi:hypothetical protein